MKILKENIDLLAVIAWFALILTIVHFVQ